MTARQTPHIRWSVSDRPFKEEDVSDSGFSEGSFVGKMGFTQGHRCLPCSVVVPRQQELFFKGVCQFRLCP